VAKSILDHCTFWFRIIFSPGQYLVPNHSHFGEDIFLSTWLN